METFKSLNYEAEALKIVNAFGLPQGCEFGSGSVRRLIEPLTVQNCFDVGNRWVFRCAYSHWGRDYELSNARFADSVGYIPYERIRIDWNDYCSDPKRIHEEAKLIFVKGFYFMGDPIESLNKIFNMGISAHDLMEWELERDSKRLLAV